MTSSSVSRKRWPVRPATRRPTDDFPQPMKPMRTRLGSTPSHSNNVLCAGTFLILIEFVFDFLALLERTEPVRLDRGKMDKDVPVHGRVHDEPKPLLLVEPLYCSSGHIRLIFFCSSVQPALVRRFLAHGKAVKRTIAT